jgi:hypothetical protein
MAASTQPVAAPSPAQIRRRCQEIQATWSPETREKRSVFKVERWMIKAVEFHVPSPRDEGDFGRVA